jgi:uncharacterized membrane protein
MPQPHNNYRTSYWLAQHWLLLVNIALGIFVLLPFLAPVFMHWGWETPGRAIHLLYTLFCHQLPQRSYFFFGPQPITIVTLPEVAAVWPNSDNPLILRQFLGNPDMGWKMAWSDRMVSMYGGIFLFGLLYALLRRVRFINPLPLWGMILFALPMAVDGTTHFVSDFAGLSAGFRYTNAWLAEWTNDAFSPAFYQGDGIGSFNWWMRLFTGLLFAMGLVWLLFPHLEIAFRQTRRELEAKMRHAALLADE